MINHIKDFKITVIMLMLVGVFYSCGKNNDEPPLKGTMWKLAGIVDTQTGVLTELNPNPFLVLIFKSNTTAFGSHDVFVRLNPVSIGCLDYTWQICYDYPYDCLFNALKEVDSFEFNGSELKFFFDNNQYYLLYQPVKPSDVFFPCGNTDEADANSPSLKGTKWKLEGIVDAKTRKLKKLFEPNDCPECYTLIFDMDTTACGRSIFLPVVLSNLNPVMIKIRYFVNWHTSVELYDDNEFSSMFMFGDILTSVESHEFNGNELKFFYNNNQNYLLYKQIKP